jgi:glycosyltransferase involved in cell wall biosynthesis
MTGLAIIILTYNEAADLPACLRAVAGWGRVIVVDSGSRDATMEIARAAGAQVYAHPFASFGEQRNWALDHCDLSGCGWVLFLDADEIATPEFRQAVEQQTAAAGEEIAGFHCCWKTILEGRWLRRCDSFPKWQFRLLRPGRARFIDSGHGQKEGDVQGEIAFIREPYLHYSFSKGWHPWVRKHNDYSTQEAADRIARQAVWQDLLSRDPSRRNRALKPLVSRLPFWPLLRFLYMYVFKLGFLEGRVGFIYCVNMAYYEFLIRIKMREAKAPSPNLPCGS